jgi:exoribonuclease R
MTEQFTFIPTDRNYTLWNNESVKNPFESKLFINDVFSIINNEVTIISSIVRSTPEIPCVIVIAGNKTYGRHEKNNKLLYKCVPDNKLIPPFLVPYEIKQVGFSKVFVNLYATITFVEWTGKHPVGLIKHVFGSVDVLVNFYEYQLCCKCLNSSIQKFQKNTTDTLKKSNDSPFQMLDKSTIENREDLNVFSIDPDNCVDFDDAFSIYETGNEDRKITCLSIYISNVTLLIDILGLWDSFSNRVSTIYLPDKKRSMLPTVLSDNLCSLQSGSLRVALFMDIFIENETIIDIKYGNAFVKLHKNYIYEEPDLLSNGVYGKLLDTCRRLTNKYKYIESIDDSHDVVCYLMILMNYHCAKELQLEKTGIFRSSHSSSNVPSIVPSSIVPSIVPSSVIKFIKIFNSARSQYVKFSDDINHTMLNLDAYIHITSPIRRLVDLLNMIEFQRVKGLIKLSNSALDFYCKWYDKLDFINACTKSIRKVQNECDLLHLCSNNLTVMQKEYDGYLFNKNETHCTVFIPDLKLTSRIPVNQDIAEFSCRRFRLFLFRNEENFKQKIRVQLLTT